MKRVIELSDDDQMRLREIARQIDDNFKTDHAARDARFLRKLAERDEAPVSTTTEGMDC